jgi:eukaryotic-like serine/threonine-protein kinase
MGAAQKLIGRKLNGRRGGSWDVLEMVTPANDLTPGQFSICYRVMSPSGHEAFLKASDLDLLTEDADLFERITMAVNAHNFERTILDHCHGSNMDRVVTALDYGDCMLTVDGVKEPLFYIVFELAQGDIRVQVSEKTRFDLIWCLGALHHIAIAINQLHGGGICHNDIKPSNILFFDKELQKLADLGCATSEAIIAPHDNRHDVGDPVYAAPESLYPCDPATAKGLCALDCRRAGDLYQLGSIAFFLITGKALTPAVVERLAPEHIPPTDGAGWTGSFQSVLPYWREAFSRALDEALQPVLPKDSSGTVTSVGESIRTAIVQLTEPDHNIRGHPANFVGHHDKRSVERFISLFDHLRLQLIVRRNA